MAPGQGPPNVPFLNVAAAISEDAGWWVGAQSDVFAALLDVPERLSGYQPFLRIWAARGCRTSTSTGSRRPALDLGAPPSTPGRLSCSWR
ncbi:hypothetical protein GCM10022214_41650 [Actinomadura miaoliensis]|uniref:Uncharacterized protein n=1 Tax=Actinomadura miaoliensis TaxID=430685 RepID=A0ABP7W249_9ACTN